MARVYVILPRTKKKKKHAWIYSEPVSSHHIGKG